MDALALSPPQSAAKVGRRRRRSQRVEIGLCGVCPAGCGVKVHFDGPRIARLTPLKGHPRGIVCPRGARAAEVIYSDDRLRYPTRRVGPRGAGRFARISWDAAFERLVGAMLRIARDHGPEAMAIYTGRGNFELGLNEAFAPAGTAETSANAVLFPFGSPNTTGVGSLCYAARSMIAPRACFGAPIRETIEDLERAGLILVWGANPATDSPPTDLRRLKHAKARGARVMVIDHRRGETARAVGAEWVAIRPGTDGALALGLLNVVIDEGLHDRYFVGRWTLGFKALAAYVTAFTPERVAAITGVAATTVRDLARAVAGARGCAILMYTGLEYADGGVQAIRAGWTLQAVCGHLDVPGGKLFKLPGRPRTRRTLTEPPPAPPPIGAAEYPLYYQTRREAHAGLLPRAILDGDPYPVRGLIVSGASLITAWPEPARWRKALAALDLLVVINRFPTADMAYADLALPATTLFETESYIAIDGVNDVFLQHRRRLIPPRGEARNDYLIFAELARRLGHGGRWPESESAMIAAALDGTGITLDDLRARPDGIRLAQPEMRYRKYETGALRADGRPGFATPSGKFEIASSWLAEHGHAALPVYSEPSEGPRAAPAMARRYPLVLNTGARTQWAFRSQHLNIPSLIRMQPRPLVHLHADDARPRGIADGDPVTVATPRGAVRLWAKVDRDIKPGVVEVNMGGGGATGPAAWRRANVNDLTDPDNVDPLSGFPVFKALLCEVRRAA